MTYLRRVACVGALAFLAGCGADGPPRAPDSGLTIGGELRIGVSGSH